MPRKKLISRVKTLVVKVGSSSVTENGKISFKKIKKLVDDVVKIRESGVFVVIVSSGSISAGIGRLEKDRNGLTIPEKQAIASVGQTILMNEYQKAFNLHNIHVGQILLTEDDIQNRRRFLNARHTILAQKQLNIVPIVNENDTVVIKEIKIGDNDTLSAHVTSLIGADLLVLLSDIDGFYWNLNDKKPVEEINFISDKVFECSGGTGSEHGTGGMYTKIKAAEYLLRLGEMMIIANGQENQILSRIMSGEKIGTIFANENKSLTSRKKWIALKSVQGELFIDDGAVEAIQKKKKSLLSSGINLINGHFEMGDLVEILSLNGSLIGRGIINYTSEELNLIKKKKTSEIALILNNTFYDEAINRDNLIIY